jgi:hypothetical protein
VTRERRLDALERALGLDWELAWRALFRPASHAVREVVPVHCDTAVHRELVRVLALPSHQFDPSATDWLETRGGKADGWLEFFDACAPYLPQRHLAHPPLYHPSRLPEPPPDAPRAVRACRDALRADCPEDWGWAVFWLWSLVVARGVRQLHAKG